MIDELCDWARSLDPLGIRESEIPLIPESVTWPVCFCPDCDYWMPANASCGHRSFYDGIVVHPGSIEWSGFHA